MKSPYGVWIFEFENKKGQNMVWWGMRGGGGEACLQLVAGFIDCVCICDLPVARHWKAVYVLAVQGGHGILGQVEKAGRC